MKLHALLHALLANAQYRREAEATMFIVLVLFLALAVVKAVDDAGRDWRMFEESMRDLDEGPVIQCPPPGE